MPRDVFDGDAAGAHIVAQRCLPLRHAGEVEAHHARQHRLGVVVVTAQKVSETERAQHPAAAGTRDPLDRLYDVHMAADDGVDPRIGAHLGIVALLVGRLERVFVPPMHVDEHRIGRIARTGDVRADGRLVDGNRIVVVRQIRKLVAVLTVAVGEHRHADPVAFEHPHRLAVLLAAVRAAGQNAVVGAPYVEGMLDAVGPDVVGVVGPQVDDAPSRRRHRIRHGVGGVVARIGHVVERLRPAEHRLLVDERDVVAVPHDRGDLGVERGEVVGAVARRPGPGIGEGEDVVVGQVVPHRGEREAARPARRGAASVEHERGDAAFLARHGRPDRGGVRRGRVVHGGACGRRGDRIGTRAGRRPVLPRSACDARGDAPCSQAYGNQAARSRRDQRAAGERGPPAADRRRAGGVGPGALPAAVRKSGGVRMPLAIGFGELGAVLRIPVRGRGAFAQLPRQGMSPRIEPLSRPAVRAVVGGTAPVEASVVVAFGHVCHGISPSHGNAPLSHPARSTPSQRRAAASHPAADAVGPLYARTRTSGPHPSSLAANGRRAAVLRHTILQACEPVRRRADLPSAPGSAPRHVPTAMPAARPRPPRRARAAPRGRARTPLWSRTARAPPGRGASYRARRAR